MTSVNSGPTRPSFLSKPGPKDRVLNLVKFFAGPPANRTGSRAVGWTYFYSKKVLESGELFDIATSVISDSSDLLKIWTVKWRKAKPKIVCRWIAAGFDDYPPSYTGPDFLGTLRDQEGLTDVAATHTNRAPVVTNANSEIVLAASPDVQDDDGDLYLLPEGSGAYDKKGKYSPYTVWYADEGKV